VTVRRLPLLCPQTYDGMTMVVTPCDRCSTGWDRELRRCTVLTGSETFPTVADPPDCPLAERCRHALQSRPAVCDVRRAGFVCESALAYAGLSASEAAGHPLSFHANMMREQD